MNGPLYHADDPSMLKLVRLFGTERTEILVRDAMREVGIASVHSADDRLKFGGALIKKGGLLEVVGRAIRVQAILQGARDEG
jgi:hypothetical protein